MTGYHVRQVASKFTLEYRAYLSSSEGKLLSPFHDVPLWADRAKGVVNMIVEVPRFSNAKLEISKEEWMNPIKQDVKKGALRFVKNCFPYHGYLWNYGAIPQTWESPAVIDSHTGFKGDNDPLDVIEVGSNLAITGQVKQVKVLGALAMLDEGETDWKIICIDICDPLASRLHDATDLDTVCPGLMEATRRWFRIYKVPDGKPENSFAFDGKVQDKEFALRIIEETHEMWQDLVKGSAHGGEKISIANRSIQDNPENAAKEAELLHSGMAKNCPQTDASLPAGIHDWAYVA